MQLDERDGGLIGHRTTLARAVIDGGVRLTWRVYDAADIVAWLAVGLLAAGAAPLVAAAIAPPSVGGLAVLYGLAAAPALALAAYRRRRTVEIDVTTRHVWVRETPFPWLRERPREARGSSDRIVRVLLEGHYAIEIPIRVRTRSEAEHVVEQIQETLAQVRGGRAGYRGIGR